MLVFRRAFALVYFAAFAVSLTVHASGWAGTGFLGSEQLFMRLHIGAIVGMFPLMIISGIDQRIDPGSASNANKRAPEIVQVLIGGFTWYVGVNFVLHLIMAIFIIDRVPRMGDPFIMRLFSGHWMIFYLMPAVALWYPPSREDDLEKAKPKRKVQGE